MRSLLISEVILKYRNSVTVSLYMEAGTELWICGRKVLYPAVLNASDVETEKPSDMLNTV